MVWIRNINSKVKMMKIPLERLEVINVISGTEMHLVILS